MNKYIFSLSLVALIMTSCYSNKVYVEQDIVKKNKKVTYEMFWRQNQRQEPYYSQSLTFSKEIDKNNDVKYTLYDVIRLSAESFDMEEDMYILLDGEVLPLPVDGQRNFKVRNVNEETSEVLRSDSTKLTVVTGYDVTERKTIQMIHPLNEEIISKIANAQEVTLRYYVGHGTINTEIKEKNLLKVKEWIAK